MENNQKESKAEPSGLAEQKHAETPSPSTISPLPGGKGVATISRKSHPIPSDWQPHEKTVQRTFPETLDDRT
jgi:hypothetical protein